ncbi:universal stress protein [Arenibacter lacus]|uniref:universal stress protein n=1 Tax=Arenibacter lacus TaxID=2608629 RepID=UPI00123D25A1|nr:universal stress protein [Arenibacter lacus]
MKNILIATDFSNDAYAALFYATQLLSSQGCTFYILHVYNQYPPLKGGLLPLIGSKKTLDSNQRESEEKLAQTLYKIGLDDQNPQHQFKSLSKRGVLPKISKQLIKAYNIDLMVMGSKGETAAKELFFGGHTIKMANALKKCPLLAIPREADFKPPKEIAFVTDFKKGCSQKTIAPLLWITALLKASLRILHIPQDNILNKVQEANRKLLQSYLREIDYNFHWIPQFEDKALVINYFIERRPIDILTMVHHKHRFLELMVREPIVQDISMYAKIPLLILPLAD